MDESKPFSGPETYVPASVPTSGSGVCLHLAYDPGGLGGGEGIATMGVEFMPVGSAPGWEGGWVDISFDDKVPLARLTLAALLGSILPLQEGAVQPVSVNEHGQQLVIVRFAIPNHANCVNR